MLSLTLLNFKRCAFTALFLLQRGQAQYPKGYKPSLYHALETLTDTRTESVYFSSLASMVNACIYIEKDLVQTFNITFMAIC